MDGSAAVHVYRVVQEALNNVTRHSGAKQAWVRLRFLTADLWSWKLKTTAKDLFPARTRQGIGLVAMRERAEIFGGTLTFTHPAEGGTLVRLSVPKEQRASCRK